MGEWRTQLGSEEVSALLGNYREALYERFSNIVAAAKADPPGKAKPGGGKDKGPGKAKGAAPKANAKENKKAAAEGAELDGPAAVVRDFQEKSTAIHRLQTIIGTYFVSVSFLAP